MATKDIVFIALFAAIIAALGLLPAIPVVGIPAPITAQTLGVMLAGAILGPKRGALAVLVFLVLVLAGLPLLAGGRGGIEHFIGNSGGFLVGWFFGAYVIGFILKNFISDTQVNIRAHFIIFIACFLGGICVVYLPGILWIARNTGSSFVDVYLGSLVFIPGDLIKAIVAMLVTVAVRRVYPMALK